MPAVLPSDLDPSKCTCSGEGLAHATAGLPTSFKIHTLDRFGNTRTAGGDSFQVSALCTEEGTQYEPLAGKVEDLGQGLYRAVCTATVAGSYEVAVMAMGKETGFTGVCPAAVAVAMLLLLLL